MPDENIEITETIENKKKPKKPHWILRFFILYLLFLIGYCSYLYFAMDVRISLKEDYQKNYGQYLVDIQDKMVGHSLDFNSMVEDTERVYTDAEKDKIKDELVSQNDLLKNLQLNPPNSDNEDYALIYKDVLKIFGFYIQGETMQAEYVYGYKDSYIADEEYSDSTTRLETYTMGTSLCNLMGNMMLNNYKYINDVRGTDYSSKYNIQPVDDLESYLSDSSSNSTTADTNTSATADTSTTTDENSQREVLDNIENNGVESVLDNSNKASADNNTIDNTDSNN